MSAKDMFEKLGFTFDDSLENEINYFNKRLISDTNVINFDLKLKKITSFVESDSPFVANIPYTLRVEELQAINKQCEGLGWLDVNTSN